MLIPEGFESEEAVVRFVRECSHPMWIFDQETLRFLEVNKAAIQTYGYSRQQFLELTVLDIRPTEDVAAFLQEEVLHRHSSISPEPWIHERHDKTRLVVDITSREMTFRGRPVEVVIAMPREIEGVSLSCMQSSDCVAGREV